MAHHNFEIDEDQEKILEQFTKRNPAVDDFAERLQLGPTGQFPEGSLAKGDEGELRFAVGVMHGKVVLDFGTPVQSLGMTADQATELGSLLCKLAEEVSSGTVK